MAVHLPDHDHCRYCGDAVPYDMAFCSEECYWNEQKRESSEKRRNIIFAALAASGLIITSIMGILMSGIL